MREGEKRDLFEQAMVPYLDAAYNLARWLTRNSHDAEDIVQEAYLRAFRYFDGFAGGDGRAWMLAIVPNNCLTSRTRQRGISVVFHERSPSPGPGEWSPQQKVRLHPRLHAFRECLELPPM